MKWTLGNLFHRHSEETKEHEENTALERVDRKETPEQKKAPVEYIVSLPEMKGALLTLWQEWSGSTIAPTLTLAPAENDPNPERTMQRLAVEPLRLVVQLEQEAKKRLKLIEKGKEEEAFSLNGSCQVYLSKDKMLAWAFFFPPYGPEGQMEAGALGKALQDANVSTGIYSEKVVQLLQNQTYFELIPIAAGTEPIEGVPGRVVELYEREVEKGVVVDEDGAADYRALNYVRQIQENDHICEIIPPQPGTPGVQVDGKVVDPKPVKAARAQRGTNTAISEDGLYLIATRTGHLEYANGAFHVRPLLEIREDVDYSTGNIEFDGDVHIHGDVREGFEVRATGNVTIGGLVEAANVEAGGDLLISRGVVGDHRALLRCKGCVRVKYLENCVLYAGQTVYADCIMSSQVFSDDSINVTSGRGSVIGGAMTAANSIQARMVGAQSGCKTELTLGMLPYVQAELLHIEEDLVDIRSEMESLSRDLDYLARNSGMEASSPRQAKAKLRRSMLAMKEKSLLARKEELMPLHPDISKCRFVASNVHPGTKLTIGDQNWSTDEIRYQCRIGYDVENRVIKEIC